jgi:hypothetical protein
MYSSILRSRLEQLLEGVTVAEAKAAAGLSEEEKEEEGLAGGQPSDRTVSILLPQPVTEIPTHIFKYLPGM